MLSHRAPQVMRRAPSSPPRTLGGLGLLVAVASVLAGLPDAQGRASPAPPSPAVQEAHPPAEGPHELARRHLELVAAVQGPSLPVTGSPSLCSARGLDLGLDSRWRQSAAPTANTRISASSLERWYFGAGACLLEYGPDERAAVTRATDGLAGELLGRSERRQALGAALDGVLETLARAPESAGSLRRLWLHSLAWEIGLPLYESAARSNRSGDSVQEGLALACRAYELLERARPSGAELAELPAALGRLAELARAPEIADLEARLLARDAAVLEVVPPSDSHAEALLGRFTARIFLTGSSDATTETLRAYLLDPAVRYSNLGSLPLRQGGLRAVLLLYFNALDEQLNVVPTEYLAYWQEYQFGERIDLDAPALEQAERELVFRTLKHEADLEHPRPAFVTARQDDMAHKSFVDAMPPGEGAPVTVLRGACLKCHTRVVETFHPGAERELRFTAPFEVEAAHLLTPFYTKVLKERLRSWRDACAAGSTDLPPPSR